MLSNNFQNILIKFGLWLGTGILIAIVGISNVFASTSYGWAKNTDLFTDVNLLTCSSTSCNSSVTLTPSYFYDSESIVKYNYFYSNTHTVTNNGDMILNFHRYNAGILYSHSKYICYSTNVNISAVDLYTGSYSDTINKVGNLDYHSYLVQTLDNHPYAPGDQYYKCNLIVDLFVAKNDGQNIGTVFRTSSNVGNTRVYLIGEKYESLGLYSETVANVLTNVIQNSGLATASNINAVNNSLNEVRQEVADINNSVDNLNDTINDDDTDGATGEASDFFEDFTTNTFGLTSIITAPLNLIQSLTSSTCTDLRLPLPFLDNKYIILPCMTPIYQQHFGSFLTIYQTITYGIIAYWVIVRIFNQVKDFKNPEHDEIEVVDL